MDGVPGGLTQVAVAPGDSFTYRFRLRDAGTFRFHADNNAWEQVGRGLYGPLIVYEDEEISKHGDVAVLVDDWRLDEKDQIYTASRGSLHYSSQGRRFGNYLTVNSRSEVNIKEPGKGPVQLRFISAANARIMRFALSSDLLMRVIAVKGANRAPFDVDQVILAPAQRVDVLIEDASVLTSLWEVSTRERVTAASFAKGNDLSP